MITLIFAVGIVCISVYIIFFDDALKHKITEKLYKNAPFYRAHLLVNQIHQLQHQQNPDSAESKALALKIEQYILFNCAEVDADKVVLKECDYVRLIQAERLIKKEMELMHKQLADRERIEVYTQHKLDIVNFALQHNVKLADGTLNNYKEIADKATR